MFTFKHKLSDEGMQQIQQIQENLLTSPELKGYLTEIKRFNDNIEKLVRFCEMVERGIVLSKFTPTKE